MLSKLSQYLQFLALKEKKRKLVYILVSYVLRDKKLKLTDKELKNDHKAYKNCEYKNSRLMYLPGWDRWGPKNSSDAAGVKQEDEQAEHFNICRIIRRLEIFRFHKPMRLN